MLLTFQKYSLYNQLIDAVENGEYMEYHTFRKFVRHGVCDKDLQKWKVTSKLYKSMEMVDIRNRCCYERLGWIDYMHKDIQYSRKCRMVIKLLLNVFRLGKDICALCTYRSMNSIDHILFECPSVKIQRTQRWPTVISKCPAQLSKEIQNMDHAHKTRFLLNAMNCNYMPEWHHLYSAYCDFIYSVYSIYYKLCNTE